MGGLARDALAYAKLPGIEVTGIDVNPQAVEIAIQHDGQGNVFFQTGDILDPNIIKQLGKEAYGAVTFIGLLTNLVTDTDAEKALHNANQLLAPGGSVVISDYVLGEGKEYWLGRYERDAKALELAGYGSKESLLGTFIVRPQGLHAQEGEGLEVEQLARDLQVGNFERLARHRRVESISNMLESAGFEIPLRRIQTQELAKQPFNPSHPWEQETNVQIRAVKPGERTLRRYRLR